MAVYIPTIEMPTNCTECKLRLIVGCHPYTNGLSPSMKRHKDCPLVEVKIPHGRLIDADAEYKALSEMKVEGEVFATAVEFAKIEIEHAQTVIEAEVE